MTFDYRPEVATRENVGLLIGLAGGTGSGKTFSAMRLAAGIAGDKPFGVIDTENRRARHYADKFRFHAGDLAPPYTPEAYAAAIKTMDAQGFPVILIDSMSHEHAGDGGLLDLHEANLQRMAGDDWSKREACKMAAWVKPKASHKAMVNKLLQVRAHLILCFRAEEKIEIVKVDGKWTAVPKKSRTGRDGWIPICEKNLPFEMTCSFLLTSDKPGVPQPIKLNGDHRHLFPLDREITEETGRALAAWAAGGKAAPIIVEQPGMVTTEHRVALVDLLARGELAAKGGAREWAAFWNGLPREDRELLLPHRDRLKQLAAESDAAVGA